MKIIQLDPNSNQRIDADRKLPPVYLVVEKIVSIASAKAQNGGSFIHMDSGHVHHVKETELEVISRMQNGPFVTTAAQETEAA